MMGDVDFGVGHLFIYVNTSMQINLLNLTFIYFVSIDVVKVRIVSLDFSRVCFANKRKLFVVVVMKFD